jgi:hypothetical protein
MLLTAWALSLGTVATAAQQAPPPPSFQVGALRFTPGGFLDFTTAFRSTAVGSGIGTNFASIPYNNTPAGHLTELRESVQNSRLSLRVDGVHQSTAFSAYVEADFLGNPPANVAVSSNSNTLRMRLFFLDARHGRWEVLAGQDWSLLTPNRSGLSPWPAEIFYTLNADTNYQVGLTWARQPQLRLTYHASPRLALAISLENGEPYIGGSAGAPQAVLPAAFAGQVNNGSSSFAAPGFAPDVIVKAAFDSHSGGRGVHLELAGLESTFRIFDPATGTTHHAVGAGVSLNLIATPTPKLHWIGTSFWGAGGGRYFFGLAPDFIVRQNGAISPVRAGGGIAGLEYQVMPGDWLHAYYGGVSIRPSFDLSGPAAVGYGFPGAPNRFNRLIQEASAGLVHTFWRSPTLGSLQLITQVAYVVRSPYSVAPGSAHNAHAAMGYLDLRYSLP